MSEWINKYLFFISFIIYMLLHSLWFFFNAVGGADWFSFWFNDKFFVFQFILIFLIGFELENKKDHILTYLRDINRRYILKRQLMRLYSQAFFCLNLMFSFILIGSLILGAVQDMTKLLALVEWYMKYLLGIVSLISILSCLKWSNLHMLKNYGTFIVFLWLAFEVVLLNHYLSKFYDFKIHILFSWIFQEGLASYLVLLIWILAASIINIRLCDKKDFS